MAEAGINLSITGDAQGFNDAATQAAKTAETTAREVADIAKRQAEAERRRYDDAMADLRRTTQARINAAKDVQKAEASAAKAAAEANTRNTAESRAAAQAKAAEAAAARRAAAAATEHQQAAAAAAAKTRQAMRDSATEATRAAEAHLRAATGLARAQAGAKARGLPGLNLPGGKERGTGQGGAGIGRAVVGALVGGAAGGAGGGGGGGGEALGSLGEATEVVEGIISGGAVEILKNGDKLVGLIGTYGGVVTQAIAHGAAVAALGVGIGQAIGDWDSFVATGAELNKKFRTLASAITNPGETARKLGEAVYGYISGANALAEQAEKMEKAFEKYQVEAQKELARRRGEAAGTNAANLGRAQQQGITSRQEIFNRNISEREAALELQKIKLDAIQLEEDKAKALADLEKNWLTEKTRLIKNHADYEYQRAVDKHAESKKELDELKETIEKNRNAAGVGGGNNKWVEATAALPGVESKYETAKSAMETAAKAAAEAESGQRKAELDKKIIDQRLQNDSDNREAERARASSALRVKQFWKRIEDATTQGIENAQNAARQAASKKEADDSLEEMELRSRGHNRRADNLRREREIQKDAKDYQARDPNVSNEEARAYAERLYDARNNKGRIRGAGYRNGKEQPAPFGLDNPGFRNLGNTQYTGINSTGTIPGGIPDPATGKWSPVPGRGPSRPAWGGSDGKGGLDGLNELQKRNHRIRGAGYKERDPSLGDVGQAAAGAAGNLAGNGVGGLVQMIVGQLSSMNKKLDYLAPSKQNIRR